MPATTNNASLDTSYSTKPKDPTLKNSLNLNSPHNDLPSRSHEAQQYLPRMNETDIHSSASISKEDGVIPALDSENSDTFSSSSRVNFQSPSNFTAHPQNQLARPTSQQGQVTSPQLPQSHPNKSSEYFNQRSTSPLDYKSNYSGYGKSSAASVREPTSRNSSSLNSRDSGVTTPPSAADLEIELPFNHSSTPVEEPRSNDLFLKLKSSQILKNAIKRTPSPLVGPDSLAIEKPVNTLEKSDTYHDSLDSPGSELDVLEDFISDIESHPGSFYTQEKDGTKSAESFMNDNTQFLVDKATSFKHPDMSIQTADELPIGVKKEKSVIDSLKQEIFQLKLHIVIMETQFNTSSNSGVAQLKSRLAESEAARIAMKNENEKLRHTMASLDSKEDGDEVNMSSAQIHELEEELLEYETALGEAQEGQEYIKEFYEREISELQDTNETLVNRVEFLEQKQEDLLETINNLKSENNESEKGTPDSRKVPTGDKDDPTNLAEIINLANDINERLSIFESPESEKSETKSIPEFSLLNQDSFYSILKRIQVTVIENNDEYQKAIDDSIKAQQDYETLMDMYKNQRYDDDTYISRYEAELAYKDLEQITYEREQEINELQSERSELWNNIRLVNQGLAEIERERNSLIQLNTHLANKNEELNEIAMSQNPIMEELESLSREYEDVQQELEGKEKILQSLSLSYSNCEAELEAKNTEVKALQERVKSLKSSLEVENETSENNITPKSSFEHDTELRSSDDTSVMVSPKMTPKNSAEIEDYILKSIRSYYNKEAKAEDLKDHIDEIFESVKQFDEIVEHLDEVNKINSDLTTLLDGKEANIETLNDTIKLNEEHESELQDKVTYLEHELNARTSECEALHRQIEELEDANRSLEIDLEAEQALRSEFSQAHSKYEKATEDLTILNSENLDLESKNAELTLECDQLRTRLEQLNQETDSNEINSLRISLAKFEKSEQNLTQKNSELQEQLKLLSASKEILAHEIDKKSHTLGEIVRRKGQLDRDMELLNFNFNQESKKAVTLERQMLSLVQAQSTSSMINASNAGAIFKQQTYQRMLELDKEVQSLRDKMKILDGELKDKNQRLNKRGTEFAILISDIFISLQKFSDNEWQSKISKILDEIGRNSGVGTEDYKKLGVLIRDCVKHISRRYQDHEDDIYDNSVD